MMKYVNKKTGYILETNSVIHAGEEWEAVADKGAASQYAEEKDPAEEAESVEEKKPAAKKKAAKASAKKEK